MHRYGFEDVAQIGGIFMSLVSKPGVTYFLPAGKRLTMQFANGITEAIGNTPLIKLKRVSAATGCTILGKAEFMNPGQSVKDRAALFIIQDAVRKGELRPGGVIVEGTAGNTGIGLALVGNAMGFRSVIVIPETQSQEKKDTLRLCGAELIEVPAVPYSNPNNYVKLSGRLAAQLAKTEKAGAIWANQFDNVANRQGPHRDDRPGNLAADRRQGRRFFLRGRHRRHARRRGDGAQRAQQDRSHRACRSDGRGALQLLHDRHAQIAGLLDHRGHRPGPHHQQSRRRADRHRLSDSRRRGGADHLRSARA